MKSYSQLYRKLPQEFVDGISAEYKDNELDKIFAGFMRERPVTLRVNTLKTDVRSVMEAFRRDNIKFERVLWYEDALVIRNKREKDLQQTALYRQGEIYLQSLSSMLPTLALQPQKGWRVLDLTAAPGSKTTQMAAMMQNDGYILANELKEIRAERLKYNIEQQGVSIAQVRVGNGKKLEEQWNGYFNAVLLDAPCSGTGLFLMNDPRTYRGFTSRNLAQLAREQRKLIDAALRALKPGGILVYSTCSIMREENEENTAWILENSGGELLPEGIGLKLAGGGVNYQMSDSQNTMLIFPSELYEGFFVSKFRKIK